LEAKLSNLSFVVLAGLFLATLVFTLVRHYVLTRTKADATWDDLLKRLSWVDRDNIATVALDAVDESGEPREEAERFALEPAAIWKLVGGLEGLEALENNCQVLVEMAAYLQKWYPEALVVAEQLRLNAREIEWHLGRLKGAAQTGNLQSSFADYAQRAVVTYYMMTQHVLALYNHANFPGLAQLQQAI
jgi:hypothetical protein